MISTLDSDLKYDVEEYLSGSALQHKFNSWILSTARTPTLRRSALQETLSTCEVSYDTEQLDILLSLEAVHEKLLPEPAPPQSRGHTVEPSSGPEAHRLKRFSELYHRFKYSINRTEQSFVARQQLARPPANPSPLRLHAPFPLSMLSGMGERDDDSNNSNESEYSEYSDEEARNLKDEGEDSDEEDGNELLATTAEATIRITQPVRFPTKKTSSRVHMALGSSLVSLHNPLIAPVVSFRILEQDEEMQQETKCSVAAQPRMPSSLSLRRRLSQRFRRPKPRLDTRNPPPPPLEQFVCRSTRQRKQLLQDGHERKGSTNVLELVPRKPAAFCSSMPVEISRWYARLVASGHADVAAGTIARLTAPNKHRFPVFVLSEHHLEKAALVGRTVLATEHCSWSKVFWRLNVETAPLRQFHCRVCRRVIGDSWEHLSLRLAHNVYSSRTCGGCRCGGTPFETTYIR